MYRIGILRSSAPDGGASLDLALEVVGALGVAVRPTEFDVGAERYARTGELLPPDVLAGLRAQDAIFSGGPPLGDHPGIPPGVLDRGITFGLRREFDLAVNLRVFTGIGPLAGADVAVVRENSEGAYSVEGVAVHQGSDLETATDVSITTYAASLRCARFAFRLARTRRGRVTLAHKPKVLTASGAVWTRATRTAAADHPDVTLTSENVDTLCASLVTDPRRYDVIVTDNVFGDIVSDVACAATRSGDHAGSAELTVLPDGPSLFEPIHGTGEPGNPFRALTAAAMLLRHIGERDTGDALAQATLAVADEHGTAIAGAELVELATAAATRLMKEKH